MIKAVIVTVSDTRSDSDDISGGRLAALVEAAGAEVAERIIVSDDLLSIREILFNLAGREDIDLILTSGGTGFGPRDNTPEATRAVIERDAPGITEAMRRETASKTPMAMLSRGVAGIRGETLIINFPGSPRAVEECFEVVQPILEHAIALISGDTKHDA